MRNDTTAPSSPGATPEAAAWNDRDPLFAAVFIEASDAMLILDGSRLIVEANQAAYLLFGHEAGELTGRILDGLLADETGDLADVWAVLLTTGQAKRRHGMAPRGQGRRAVECSYRILVEGDRYLCVVRDTVDRRLLEARLAQAEKMDSLGRLAGGIAHDFNNLLTAVLGYTELLLQSRGSDPGDRADLEQIRQAGERAAALTHQLLAYSRKQVLAPTEVDLNRKVTDLRSMLTRLIREDISVICQPAARPAFLRIDPTQLEHVIVNLVLNARDAIPAEGTIRIAVAVLPATDVRLPWDLVNPTHLLNRVNSNPSHLVNPVNAVNPSHLVNPLNPVNPVQDYIQLRISDDGVGIPSEAHAHLFEPFFSTADAWRRTGLGLASVYGIVRQSDGFIEVESEIGRGTTFSMYFPATAPVNDAAMQPRETPATERAANHTILLVEDEDAVRRIAGTILRRHGYHVIEASTPRAALELFAGHSDAIDLLLSDIVMPEMNGPGLAQRLVALKPSLRVVFMSGYADVGSPFEIPNPRISFLSKPFPASALLSIVQAALAGNKVKP